MIRNRIRTAVIVIAAALSAQPSTAQTFADLAKECVAALEASDTPRFDLAAEAVKRSHGVLNIAARETAAACLSQGYGEPWIYHERSGQFMSEVDYAARYKAADAALAYTSKVDDQNRIDEVERLAEQSRKEAARAENADRVAALVYVSCLTLFTRDRVAAMTNAVCVESFLQTGLPASAAP